MLGVEKGKERHTGELQDSTPASRVWRARSAAGLPPGRTAARRKTLPRRWEHRPWETPALFCGNPRMRYGCFNPQLVNPAKYLIQLHTPKCSWWITHNNNRESISVERRLLNHNWTEINFCTRITRYYHNFLWKITCWIPKQSLSANSKYWLYLHFTHNTCVLLRTTCQIPPQDHLLHWICPGSDHRYQRVKSQVKREACRGLPS